MTTPSSWRHVIWPYAIALCFGAIGFASCITTGCTYDVKPVIDNVDITIPVCLKIDDGGLGSCLVDAGAD